MFKPYGLLQTLCLNEPKTIPFSDKMFVEIISRVGERLQFRYKKCNKKSCN